MDKDLEKLFDFQRFAENKRLSAMLAQAEESLTRTLSDEELELVNAAGDPAAEAAKQKLK